MIITVEVDKPVKQRKLQLTVEGTTRELLAFAEDLENAGEYGAAEDIREAL